MDRYGVQIKRNPNPDLPLAMRRIASQRGNGQPYTVSDLYRDCLIAYTHDHKVYRTVEFTNFIIRTVYVREPNKTEHRYFIRQAKSHGLKALGRLLEAAIEYHCGEDIAAQLTLIAQENKTREPYHADQEND